jgi:hypothetical protein
MLILVAIQSSPEAITERDLPVCYARDPLLIHRRPFDCWEFSLGDGRTDFKRSLKIHGRLLHKYIELSGTPFLTTF